VRKVAFEQDGVFSSGSFDGLRARLAREKNVDAELAGRHSHDDVGRAEALNDLLTRTAEIDVACAGKGKAWLLDARLYALRRINARRVGKETVPRSQRFTQKPVDLSKRTPYLWGTEVVIANSRDASEQIASDIAPTSGCPRTMSCKPHDPTGW
jgi:hypothetical protein